MLFVLLKQTLRDFLHTCVQFSPYSTPQASRNAPFLTDPSLLVHHFNARRFRPRRAAPEQLLRLHTLGVPAGRQG